MIGRHGSELSAPQGGCASVILGHLSDAALGTAPA